MNFYLIVHQIRCVFFDGPHELGGLALVTFQLESLEEALERLVIIRVIHRGARPLAITAGCGRIRIPEGIVSDTGEYLLIHLLFCVFLPKTTLRAVSYVEWMISIDSTNERFTSNFYDTVAGREGYLYNDRYRYFALISRLYMRALKLMPS